MSELDPKKDSIVSYIDNESKGIHREAKDASARENIAKLQRMMAEEIQIDCPLTHLFTTGVYARTILIPKGTIIVGKIHKHDHLNFIHSGDVTVSSEYGSEQLKGPLLMVSKAGTKRAVYANDDTIWTTIHANPDDDTDLESLEGKIIAKDYEELADMSQNNLGLKWQENYQ